MNIKLGASAGALAFLASTSAFALLPPPPSAGYTAEVFSFGCITDCDTTTSLGEQLFLQVIRAQDPASPDTNVYFKFWNLVGIPSSVARVSVDGWSDFTLLGGLGTNFVTANSPNPKVLPGGATLTPAFKSDFTFEAQPAGPGGKPVAGIDTSTDTLEFYTSSLTFQQVIAAIGSGDLRFGLHVIASQATDGPSYLGATAPVPEGSTLALLLSGLGLVAFIGRRRLRLAA